MKKNKEVIILVGNIGSGKSTLTKKFQQKDYIVIARDQIRYAIGGGNYIFDLNYEPIIWEVELYMFTRFLELGINIVVDEVGINKKQRARYILLAKQFKYKVKLIEMPKLTMQEAVNRRMNDTHHQPDRKIWEQVWKKFNRLYEKPTKKEGIDKIVRLK